jgi:hypothetical protein
VFASRRFNGWMQARFRLRALAAGARQSSAGPRFEAPGAPWSLFPFPPRGGDGAPGGARGLRGPSTDLAIGPSCALTRRTAPGIHGRGASRRSIGGRASSARLPRLSSRTPRPLRAPHRPPCSPPVGEQNHRMENNCRNLGNKSRGRLSPTVDPYNVCVVKRLVITGFRAHESATICKGAAAAGRSACAVG